VPAQERSVELTNAYRGRLVAMRHTAARATRVSFARIDPDDLDGSYAAWQQTATALLGATKRQGAALSQRYLAAYISSETGRRATVADIDPDAYGAVDRMNRPLERSLLPPLLTVKIRLGQGAAFPAALAAGAARMTRTVAGESMAAPRQALGDLMAAQDDVIGWHRVTTGNACGACLAAATGALRADDEVPEAHDACQCVAEAVIAGARNTIRRPTGREVFLAKSDAEQAALFHGRGGAEKAKLIRDGDVPFEALIAHDHRAEMPDGITEAPLSALATG
jgi:hypothetical protein